MSWYPMSSCSCCRHCNQYCPTVLSSRCSLAPILSATCCLPWPSITGLPSSSTHSSSSMVDKYSSSWMSLTMLPSRSKHRSLGWNINSDKVSTQLQPRNRHSREEKEESPDRSARLEQRIDSSTRCDHPVPNCRSDSREGWQQMCRDFRLDKWGEEAGGFSKIGTAAAEANWLLRCSAEQGVSRAWEACRQGTSLSYPQLTALKGIATLLVTSSQDLYSDVSSFFSSLCNDLPSVFGFPSLDGLSLFGLIFGRPRSMALLFLLFLEQEVAGVVICSLISGCRPQDEGCSCCRRWAQAMSVRLGMLVARWAMRVELIMVPIWKEWANRLKLLCSIRLFHILWKNKGLGASEIVTAIQYSPDISSLHSFRPCFALHP